MRVSLLLSLQRKKEESTENPRSRQAAECSFLSDQKGTEKVTATSEARGTARGLHAPKTPKEEVAHAKTGKNAWKDCFSCRFGGAPLTIRVCPNPREYIFSGCP